MKEHFLKFTFCVAILLFLTSGNLFAQDSKNTGKQNVFKNPILSFDFSDPDVVRVGNDYYMTASSFNFVPGLPILHSTDLVNWTLIGHALNQLPDALYTYARRSANELDYSAPRLGCGVYAPAIRYHDSFYWIYWGDPDGGIYMVKSKNPKSGWSKPQLVHAASGIIDPCPFWDEETGKAYLSWAYAKSRAGINEQIDVCEMSFDGTTLLGKTVTVFSTQDSIRFPADRYHKTIEGTKFMKHDGWYYILCPAGSVETGWQAAMRSRHPMGPYEIRTVCETGSTNINGPHQGALVETKSGKWWFVHFQSVGTLGRIVRLEPAFWENNWPVIGTDDDNDGIGNPVYSFQYPLPPKNRKVQTSDSFNKKSIGLQWQFPANYSFDWFSIEKGNLILPAIFNDSQSLEKISGIITQMFPAFTFNTTVKMKVDGDNIRAGLATMGRKCFDIGIEKQENKKTVVVRFDRQILDSTPYFSDSVQFRLNVKGELPLPLQQRAVQKLSNNGSAEKLESWQSDDLERWSNGILTGQFSYSLNGKEFIPIGPSFEVRSGLWVGARFGLYCIKARDNASGKAIIADVKISNN